MSEFKPHTPMLTLREQQHLEERHNAFVKRYMEKEKERTTAELREARKNGTLRQRMPPRPDSPDGNRPQS